MKGERGGNEDDELAGVNGGESEGDWMMMMMMMMMMVMMML